MACNIFLTLPGNIKMPALGYGTWDATDDSLEKALEVALEAGYRHIDTAQSYYNEETVGKVLQRWFDAGKLKREDIFITTKLNSFAMHPDTAIQSLEDSLRKLRLNYVDLFLMHFPLAIVTDSDGAYYGDPDVDYVEVWKKMEELYDAGKVRSIGISNFSIKKIERLLKNCRIKPANNQVEMHVYLQQKELVDYCTKNGITVVAYSPLGCKEYNKFLTKMGQPAREIRDILEDDSVKEIAKKHSKSPAQVILRFLLQLGVAPIPKSVTASRVKENFNVFDFSLDDQDLAKLRALDIGDDARVVDWKCVGRLHEHPDYGF